MIELVKLITFVPSYKRFIYFGLSMLFWSVFFIALLEGNRPTSEILGTGAIALWLLIDGGFSYKAIWNLPRLKSEKAILFKAGDHYIVSSSREEAELWADLKGETGEVERIDDVNFFQK